MKKTAVVVAASLSSIVFGHDAWEYSGDSGPAHWGRMHKDYAVCDHGKNQSPINLDGFIKAELAPILISYNQGAESVVNNGHTIQVNCTVGSSFSLDKQRFELKQIHFHAPSENQIMGRTYPLEMHLVHANEKGSLAVIAVMFEEGQENEPLASLWSDMPEKAGDSNRLSAALSPEKLLPPNLKYYRFNGSLTTPPCSEGVLWLVMKSPLAASNKQIARFTQVMGHHNNRPVQPLNARAVLE